MQDNLFISKSAKFVTFHPWRVLLITALLVSGMTVGIVDITFKSDYLQYFSKDNPQLLDFNAIQDEYNKSDNIVFIIEPLSKNIFEPTILQAIESLTEKSWQIPYSSRVDSITNFQHTTSTDDDLFVSSLVPDATQLTQAEISSIKKIALNEPLLANRLISKTGHVSSINVTVQLPGKSTSENIEAVTKARILAKEIEQNFSGIKIYISGMVMMENAFTEATINDATHLMPIMYGIVILMLVIFLRSITATISIILLIIISSASALGVAGWVGWSLNPTSAIAPMIILTLVIADCIHILITMLHNMQDGLSKKSAIQESLRVNFQPIVLTSLTTAIGFLTMNFSDSPPFRELGNIVASGAVIAMILSLFFLPALISLLPIKVKIKKKHSNQIMGVFASFVIKYHKQLFIFNTLLAIVFISCLPLNQLNDEFVKYFDETMEFRQSTDFLNENLGGLYTIEYSIHAGEEGSINDPIFLTQIDAFTFWLKNQPEVTHVNSITDTYKRLNKNMHGDDNAWYKLPERRDIAAQYLLMYEMSLPYGLDLNGQINMAKSGVRITVTLQNMSSNQVLSLEEKFNTWLENTYPNLHFENSSTVLMFAHIGKRNIIQMITGTLTALLLISFILIFAFKSLKLGFISLIPNLVPAGIAFGFWGVFNGNIDLALSVIMGITLGIVVDDTIHFISKYRRAKVEMGLDETQAVQYAFSTVGMALCTTSAVLISGFIVLSFSHFKMNAEMGLMTAITIFIALIMDFLLLPPLLMKLDKK